MTAGDRKERLHNTRSEDDGVRKRYSLTPLEHPAIDLLASCSSLTRDVIASQKRGKDQPFVQKERQSVSERQAKTPLGRERESDQELERRK